ncbi:hypothetical protein BJY01DRAFT_225021 [Aspergillus pseudoustus]|uniref:Uncharacterized protein n=1 Tax=Aspergillus pseudoustus TaxID=1810923 RepID=A0ABR4J0M0_9EURO
MRPSRPRSGATSWSISAAHGGRRHATLKSRWSCSSRCLPMRILGRQVRAVVVPSSSQVYYRTRRKANHGLPSSPRPRIRFGTSTLSSCSRDSGKWICFPHTGSRSL